MEKIFNKIWLQGRFYLNDQQTTDIEELINHGKSL